MPTERRPNLFLVGAQKSGTTTLATLLSCHPQVFFCSPKEPGFLAFGERGYPFPTGRGEPAAASDWVVQEESSYLQLFARAPEAASYLGDASTWYLSEPGTAERIQAFSPDARIIVILRHPAERAYSAWSHARRDGEEPLADFADALAAETARQSPSHLLRYRAMGRYASQLRPYLETFGRERVLVLRYEDLRDSVDALWLQCLLFLELDPSLPAPKAYRQNRSGMPRSRQVQRLLKHEGFKSTMKRLLPTPLAAWSKAQVDRLNLERFPPMPPAARELLVADYREEVRELEAMTGLDLSAWQR
ncbi:sulfotransferase [Pseudohaliea sp.]|uniref:sulfotransferase family protein n=1 Tax=Pseudohaliea sp. TaxID=2740289 RepID=UPI0032F0262F